MRNSSFDGSTVIQPMTYASSILALFLLFFIRKGDVKMSLLQNSTLFLKRHASTILAYVGGAGVIATSVMAVKATPKALALLENAKKKKGEGLTKLEKIKVAGIEYIPAIIIGVSTIVCIFVANALNKRQQAALISAYALLNNSYKDYKKKLAELYGEDSVEEIKKEIAKDKYEKCSYPLEDGKELFYDNFSQRYFNATTEQVLQAEHTLNRRMNYAHDVYLNEFYELLGLEPTDYGDFLGWSYDEIYDVHGESWIEFDHSKTIMDDGLEVNIIYIRTEPTFGFENY